MYSSGRTSRDEAVRLVHATAMAEPAIMYSLSMPLLCSYIATTPRQGCSAQSP